MFQKKKHHCMYQNDSHIQPFHSGHLSFDLPKSQPWYQYLLQSQGTGIRTPPASPPICQAKKLGQYSTVEHLKFTLFDIWGTFYSNPGTWYICQESQSLSHTLPLMPCNTTLDHHQFDIQLSNAR